MEKFTSDVILEAAINDAGDLDASAMRDALDAAGFDTSGLYDDDMHALAAAIEYYGADVADAVAVIQSGEYKFFLGAQTYEDLGWALVGEQVNVNRLPDIITDYMDFEAAGEDYERDTQGQFTRFGYFTPEKR